MKTIADLEARLGELHQRTRETPLFNPVFQLSLDLSRQLESGEMTLEDCAALVEELGAARRLLDAALAAIRRHAIAEEALRRAREAVEDRSGPAREEARRALNAASLEVERAGAAADAAWDAWRQAVQAVLLGVSLRREGDPGPARDRSLH